MYYTLREMSVLQTSTIPIQLHTNLKSVNVGPTFADEVERNNSYGGCWSNIRTIAHAQSVNVGPTSPVSLR